MRVCFHTAAKSFSLNHCVGRLFKSDKNHQPSPSLPIRDAHVGRTRRKLVRFCFEPRISQFEAISTFVCEPTWKVSMKRNNTHQHCSSWAASSADSTPAGVAVNSARGTDGKYCLPGPSDWRRLFYCCRCSPLRRPPPPARHRLVPFARQGPLRPHCWSTNYHSWLPVELCLRRPLRFRLSWPSANS